MLPHFHNPYAFVATLGGLLLVLLTLVYDAHQLTGFARWLATVRVVDHGDSVSVTVKKP